MLKKLSALGFLCATLGCLIVVSAWASSAAGPAVTDFTPKKGSLGTKVTITGTALSGSQVAFNGAPATSVATNAAGNIVAAVPNDPDVMPVGSQVEITVTNSGGTTKVPGTFLVTSVGPPAASTAKPQITAIAPARAKVGAKITITGKNLDGTQWVKLGGVKVTFTVPSAGKVIATVTKQARSGVVSLKTSNGTSSTSQHLTIAGM